MFRRALLLFLPILLLSLRALAAPPEAIPVEAYRTQLQKAAAQLERIEARAPHNLAPILNPLQKERLVRRADGKTQTASGDEFSRLLKDLPANAPRETVKNLRQSLLARETALSEWAQSTHTPADAQAIISQLESSGQIRTGPTWLQQTWANFNKWIADSFKKLLDWISGLFPDATPGKMPTVDPALIKALFTITVIALLAAIAFLIWRAIGGKISRRSKQGAFAFSPEDAELLSLPPDELRERARKFAADGNFREALRHLYISLLLNLDARGVWRYDARRTNWEHIAALKNDTARSTLVAPLSDLTHRFDRVRYGNAECGPADWSHFERDVSALEASTPGA